MTVIFDLYLFTEKYIKEAKRREKTKKKHKEQEVDFEIGAVACRNTRREQPVFIYDVDELTQLLEAGYAIGSEMEAGEQRVKFEDFPAESVNAMVIELEQPFTGKLIGPGEETAFSSETELKDLVNSLV